MRVLWQNAQRWDSAIELEKPTLRMTPATHLIRILCVDDHPLLRAGIGTLIATQADMQLVGEASTGKEAVQFHRELNPDVTLMDLQMPDMSGLDAIIAIRSESPSARIIVLTTYAGDALAQRALKAGAQAYVLKSLVRTAILNTIRVVYAGERCVQADVAAEIAKHTADAALTTREVQVLQLVASGHANKEISARSFSVAKRTSRVPSNAPSDSHRTLSLSAAGWNWQLYACLRPMRP